MRRKLLRLLRLGASGPLRVCGDAACGPLHGAAGNGCLRRSVLLLGPSKKRSPGKGTRSATAAATPCAKAAPAVARGVVAEAKAKDVKHERLRKTDVPTDGEELGREPTQEVPRESVGSGDAAAKPAPLEFALEEPVAADEAATEAEKSPRLNGPERSRQTRDVLDALLARATEAICESESVPMPPRVLSARQGRSEGGAATAPLHFCEAPRQEVSEPAALTPQQALENFAEAFAATLFRWSPHTPAEQILIAAAATSPAFSETLLTVAPFSALAGRFHDVVREVVRSGPPIMLAHSLLALCDSHHAAHGLMEDADRLDEFVKRLMKRIDAAAVGAGDYTAHLNAVKTARPFHAVAKKTTASTSTPSQTTRLNTLTSVLQRVVLELYLVSALLHPPPTGSAASGSTELFRRVAHGMLRHLTDDAVYTFHVKQRRGGKAGAATLTAPKVTTTVQSVSCKGLEALMKHSILKQTHSGGGGGNHVTRDDRRMREAFNALCAQYLACLPEAVHACGRATSDRATDAETVAVGGREGGPAGVIAALVAAWRASERQVRLDGVVAALPWLRLVPQLFAAMSQVAETRMELVVVGTGAGSHRTVRGCTGDDDDRLAVTHRRLSELLQGLLSYDRLAYEHQRRQRGAAGDPSLSAALVAGGTGGERPATAEDGLLHVKGSTALAGADGATAAPAAAEDDDGTVTDSAAPLGRKRGKRSMFYRDADGASERVLLPHTSRPSPGSGAATQVAGAASPAAGTSRFVSRGLHGGNGSGDGVSRADGAGVTHSTGKKGSSSTSVETAALPVSALFDVMVNARETEPLLVERYALGRLHRETTIEDCWLGLVHALGRAQQLLYSPPAGPVDESMRKRRESRGGVSDGVDGLASSPGDHLRRQQQQQQPSQGRVTLSPAHLPERLRTMLEAHPAATRREQERRLADALRVLLESQALMPTHLFDSALRMAGRLSHVLIRVSSVAGRPLPDSASPRLAKKSIRLGFLMQTHAAFTLQQRRLNLLLVAGAAELVWLDGSVWDGVWRTWHLRVAPLPGSAATASLRNFARWTAAANKLLARLSEEQFLVAQQRRAGQFDMLLATAQEALRTLQGDTTAAAASGTAANAIRRKSSNHPPQQRQQHLHAPLSVLGRQSAAALLLTSLHSCVDNSIGRGEWAAGAGPSTALVTRPHNRESLASLLFSLLHLLEKDPELTLLCGYPVFLQMLYETFMHLSRDNVTGNSVKARMHGFISSHLFPILLPAILESLKASRSDAAATPPSNKASQSHRSHDGTEASASVMAPGHAAQCELTLLLLAELSRLCLMRRPKEPMVADATAAGEGGAPSPWADCLMQLGVYCLRQSRRSGFRKARDFDLPAPTLPHVPPWSSEVRRRCGWLLSGTADTDGGGGGGSTFIPFLNWSNELMISGYMKAELRTHDRTAVTALEDFQRALDTDVSFAPPLTESLPAMAAPEHASLAALTPAALVATLDANHAGMVRWHAAVAHARREAIRNSPFFTNQRGGGAAAARRLHYLVQFMDMHLQKEERRARNAAIAATSPAAAGTTAQGDGAPSNLARAAARAGDALSYGLSTLDDSPLIVLDFLGYLTSEGGWAMVRRAFCVCDTAFRVERRRHRHALAEVREAAVTAVLSQLRVVPAPHLPAILIAKDPARRTLLPSHLSLSLIESACSLSDAVSRDGSLTLLGCGRRDPVTAMLSNPSAEECRSMLFGVKQVTVYVEAEAQRYCSTGSADEEEGRRAAAQGRRPDVGEDETDVVEDGDASSSQTEAVLDESYFNFLTSHAPSTDAEVASLCARHRGEFRIFAASLVAAVDLNLEVARHHALQTGVMDADMRSLLFVSYTTLVEVFLQSAQTLLRLLRDHPQHHQTDAPHFLFLDECALLALSGLCLSASISHVAPLDVAGLFFRGSVRTLSHDLIDTTHALVRAAADSVARDGAASLSPVPAWAALERHHNAHSGSSGGDHGDRPIGSLLDGVDAAGYPIASLLTRAVELLSRDMRLSRRVLLRFGLAQFRERHDLTATLLALHGPTSRVVAASAGGDCALAMAGVRLFHSVWDGVRGELLHGRHGGGGEPTQHAHAPSEGKRARKKTTPFAPAPAGLPVTSLPELRLVLAAYGEFDAATTAATECAHGGLGETASTPSRVWGCGDASAVEQMLRHVREVPSLLPRSHAAAPLLLPDAAGTRTLGAWQPHREGDEAFDERETTADLEEDESSMGVAGGSSSARVGSPGSLPTTWSAAFLTTFPDVAEVLAGHDGSAGTEEELVDAVIQQGSVLRRVYKGREKGSAPLMLPQLEAMKDSFGRNVMALLQALPLAVIAERPNAAEGFFSALDVFLNPAKHAIGELGEGEGGLDNSGDRDRRDKAGRKLVDMARRQALCALLEEKLTEELIKPAQKHFELHQEHLLEAVRAERALSERGAVPSSGGSGRDLFCVEAAAAEDRSAMPLTWTAARLTLRTLRQSSAPEEHAFRLAWQDDIRFVTHRATHAPGEARLKPPEYARVYANCLCVPRHLPVPRVSGAAVSSARPLPLAVVLALLRVLVNGEKEDAATRRLAEVAATYAMRQYVLLRPRLAGTALNVLPLLYGTAAAGLSTKLEPRDVQVLLDWRLPLKSAYVDGIAGKFFTKPQQDAFRAQFAAAASGDEAGDKEEHTHEGRHASVEQLVFDYIRSGALYMHLLSVISALLFKFEIYGDLPHDELSSLKRRYVQMAKAAKRESNGRGGARDGDDTAASSSSADMARLTGREALQRELQESMLLRQTTPQGVNANLLETAMLHFLNVSCVMLQHTDTLTHMAVDRTMAVRLEPHQPPPQRTSSTSGESGVSASEAGGMLGAEGPPTPTSDGTVTALTAYASELRVLMVAAFQDSVTTVMHQSERAAPLSLTHRVLNYIICTTPCGLLTQQQLSAAPLSPSAQAALSHWHRYRPEWFSCSPTLLAVISPHYFIRCLANSVRFAPSEAVANIAVCFGFYAQRSDMGLAPLLTATTELLTATPLRNTALTVYCETLADSLVQRDEFKQALAPPTIASRDQGPAGSVSNEVLIPFLAAVSRHDVHVSKHALATLLHIAMKARADVFGLPPIPDRQGKLSLVKAAAQVGGAFDTDNPLYAPARARQPAKAAESRDDGAGEGTAEALHVLDAFAADADTAARTHHRGLAGLNLSLPAVMEVAGHMRAMRRPSYAEAHRARAMLRAADDARRERVAVYRSSLHSGGAVTNASPTGGAEMAAAAVAKLDASLRLDDPNDFGVALLHLHYALRKVVHASFRRLAGSQSPRVIAEMLEMLLETDEGFRRWWQQLQRRTAVLSSSASADDAAAVRAQRRAAFGLADTGRHSAVSVAATASAALSAASASPAPLRDAMLAGTLRLLVARALTCALSAGYDGGAPLMLPAGVGASAATTTAALTPLLTTALQGGSAEGRQAKGAAESSASAAMSASLTLMSHRGRQRVLRALAAARRTNRLAALREASTRHQHRPLQPHQQPLQHGRNSGGGGGAAQAGQTRGGHRFRTQNRGGSAEGERRATTGRVHGAV